MKDAFPSWAPEKAIKSYESEKSYSAYIKDKYGADRQKDHLGCYCGEKPDGLLALKKNLLTVSAGEEAFAALKTISETHHYKRDLSELVFYVLDSAYYACANAYSTQAVQRKIFESIAKTANELLELIDGDRFARQLADETIRTCIEWELQEYRHEDGEQLDSIISTPSISPGMFYGTEADLDKQWNERSNESRLGVVCDVATNLLLTDVLKVFSGHLADLSKTYQAEVKQPNRGDQIRPVLIRKLTKFFQCTFNQPYPETVAKIVSAALNLETPLSRDDIRPYIRGGDKSQTL